MTLAEIRDKKLSCIIHTPLKAQVEVLIQEIPSARDQGNAKRWIDYWDNCDNECCYHIVNGEIDGYCERGYYIIHHRFTPIYEFSDLFATGGVIPTPSKPVSIEEQFGLPKGLVLHDLPTSEWHLPMRLKFKNGSSIEAIPNKDVIRNKEPELVWIDNIKLPTAAETKEQIERVMREFQVSWGKPVILKEEEKMSTKFTFYVTEGTRVDKSCNGTIPTVTTTVEANSYSRTAPVGTATCDKANYDMRQGVLEALANMYCDGDFDKVFNKAVKRNKLADKKKRTCTYCGQLFDTVAEKEAHEAWHVERRKARHERYLLRKRAKEIAFEEAAQKLAKEIIAEDKKK